MVATNVAHSPAITALFSLQTDSLLDYSPLIHTVSKLLEAIRTLADGQAALYNENQDLKREVQALRKDIDSMKKNGDTLKAHGRNIEVLTSRIGAVESTLGGLDVVFLKSVSENLSRMQAQHASIDSMLTQLNSETKHEKRRAMEAEGSLKTELAEMDRAILVLQETKATVDETKHLQELVEVNSERIEGNCKETTSTRQHIDLVEAKLSSQIVTKAEIVAVEDKLGRSDADELMQSLTFRIFNEMNKNAAAVMEMREDVDFMLKLFLQKEETASGAFKCLSCAKIVPVSKPGPPANSGRSPVLTQGDDGHYYYGKRVEPGTGDVDVNAYKSMVAAPPPSSSSSSSSGNISSSIAASVTDRLSKSSNYVPVWPSSSLSPSSARDGDVSPSKHRPATSLSGAQTPTRVGKIRPSTAGKTRPSSALQ